MKQAVYVIPEAQTALYALAAATQKAGLSPKLVELVNMRASQINGCSVCLDGHWRIARKEGETDERMFAVAGWRDAPYYTDAERAALELTEALTRLADQSDAVPDELWERVKRHYDEPQLAALLLTIAQINVWNRLNVATRQVAGAWKP